MRGKATKSASNHHFVTTLEKTLTMKHDKLETCIRLRRLFQNRSPLTLVPRQMMKDHLTKTAVTECSVSRGATAVSVSSRRDLDHPVPSLMNRADMTQTRIRKVHEHTTDARGSSVVKGLWNARSQKFEVMNTGQTRRIRSKTFGRGILSFAGPSTTTISALQTKASKYDDDITKCMAKCAKRLQLQIRLNTFDSVDQSPS